MSRQIPCSTPLLLLSSILSSIVLVGFTPIASANPNLANPSVDDTIEASTLGDMT